MRITFVWFLSVSLIAAGQSPKTITTVVNQYKYAVQKKVVCKNGAVVSAHPLASRVGLEMLKKGGNSFDAAIATQLALAVVYPDAGNIGGGGFMVARTNDGKNIAIDFREKAPGKASRDMYLDANGYPKEKLSEDGHLAAGIPGTIAGAFAIYKYAKLPFKTLIQPAIDLAEKGHAITESEAKDFNELKNEFIKLNTVTPAFVKDREWKAGDTLIQKDLAETLKRVRDFGEKGFYEGRTAELIVEEMKRGGGIITLDDLKNYKVAVRTAVEFNYRKDYTIITMPLPSSGSIILQQVLKIAEMKNLSKYSFHSPEAVQLITEAERRAYADRAKFMGDPDFVKVPYKTLVSDNYITQRIADYEPGKAGNSKTTQAGNISESEETTHLSIIDKWGNCVSITTTLNGGFGSRTVVGGAGFILNNEMDDFSIKPGVPNMYGAVGGEANAIAPNKRMLSSMSPSIVLKNGKPYLVVGTPGGTTIPTSVIQSIVNVIDFGLSTEDAVNKPKFHHQWLPDIILVEKGFPEATKDKLTQMGYKIVERGAIGRTEMIKVSYQPQTNKMKIEAVGDHRGDDDAEGY
ncbi:MAG: gamma-glutamyltransferase [Sphingobacteriales bacterium]|nr:gamma-glutamyltransferase [Sphingobacteriales bacterium]